jgi:hypothetical protein
MLTKVAKTDNRENAEIDPLGAIKKYLSIYKHTNLGMVDEVYYLLGEQRHGCSVDDYQYCCIELLAALADPNTSQPIKARMGNYGYENLINMLTRMWSFCRAMSDEAPEAMLTAYRLENDSEDLSTEALARIEKEYKAKLEQHNKMQAA